MNVKTLMAIAGLTLFALVTSPASYARTKAEINASADKALQRFYAISPRNKELADKSAGVLIFGRVTKGGAGIAGEFGEGVLRVSGSAVDYYSVTSGSVGLTLGSLITAKSSCSRHPRRWTSCRRATTGQSVQMPPLPW